MKKYLLALDLIPNPMKIEAYEDWHTKVWPEVLQSIQDAGILSCQIFRVENRLTMVLETTDSFSFEEKSKADQSNEKVQEWETLMWNYQQAIPGSKPGEKWRLMHCIFNFQSSKP